MNVSSAAALAYYPGLMAYGMAKVTLEHLTVSAAEQLHDTRHRGEHVPHRRARRVGGLRGQRPSLDHSTWEESNVAAEGIVWMVCQPASYTGRNDSMVALRADHGIMGGSRVQAEPLGPGTDLHLG